MKVRDITESRVTPDAQFLQELGFGVDEALEEYAEFLNQNDDRDDFHELASLLEASVDEDLRMQFVVNEGPRKSEEWMYAEAISGETEDGERVTDIIIYLNAQNMDGIYGPKTFKKILMRTVSHELVHKDQHSRIPDLDKMSSGYQKAANAKTHREFMRKYLRDPAELMAYGETLAQEIADTEDPHATIRNPEAYMEYLPTYAKFRQVFPRGDRYIQRLLKYTSDYLPDYA